MARASLLAGLRYSAGNSSCELAMDFFGMERPPQISVGQPFAAGSKWVLSRNDLYWFNTTTRQWVYWKSTPLKYADAQPYNLPYPQGINWVYYDSGVAAPYNEAFPNLPRGYYFRVLQPIWWQDASGRTLDSTTLITVHQNQRSTETGFCMPF